MAEEVDVAVFSGERPPRDFRRMKPAVFGWRGIE
jgi:hypothetical protein